MAINARSKPFLRFALPIRYAMMRSIRTSCRRSQQHGIVICHRGAAVEACAAPLERPTNLRLTDRRGRLFVELGQRVLG